MLLLLMDRFGLPRGPETASRLGLSKTSFYRYLALADAPADVREALDAGVLGLAQAERIAAIEPPQVRGNLIQAAKDGVPASRIEEAIESHRAGEAIPTEVLNPNAPPRHQGPRGGGQESAQTWSLGKVRELSRLLGLKTSALDAIAKALKARRVSAAHATAAALVVSAGQPATQAFAVVAALDRPTLRAIETLFKVVYRPSRKARSGALVALHLILTVLERELESRSGSASRN